MHKTSGPLISHSRTCNLQACQKKKIFPEKSGLPNPLIEAFQEAPEKSEKTEKAYLLHIDKKISSSDGLLILAGAVEKQDT